MSGARRVVVVGGGLAGLVAAYRLTQAADAPRVRLYEAAHQVGGKLRTHHAPGWVVEEGADGFTPGSGAVAALARSVGIADELIACRPCRVRAYVRRGERLVPLLAGGASPVFRPASLLRHPALSLRARLRVAMEPFVPRRRSRTDESVDAFLSRRLGRPALRDVLDPLLSGIHGAPTLELSARTTLPHLVAAEEAGRSLLRGTGRRAGRTDPSARGLGDSPLLSFRAGMSALPAALAAALGPDVVLTGKTVTHVVRRQDAWDVHTSGAPERADAVILATPAPVAALILAALPALARSLRGLGAAHATVVNLAYDAAAVGRRLDAHGYLEEAAAAHAVTACTWSSTKFEGRAPDGGVLLRAFLRGGAAREEDVSTQAHDALSRVLDLRAPPLWCRVSTWQVPVFRIGHGDRVADVRAGLAEAPRLHLAGAWYDGASIEAAIRSGEGAAAQVLTGRTVGEGGARGRG